MDIKVNIRVGDILLPFIVKVKTDDMDKGILEAIETINKKFNLQSSAKITREDIQEIDLVN